MKGRNNRKLLLHAAVYMTVYALVKLAAAFVLMPSQVPFVDFEDSSSAMAVAYLLLQPFILACASICSDRLVPAGTDDDDDAPGAAKDGEYHVIRDVDPEATGSKN